MRRRLAPLVATAALLAGATACGGGQPAHSKPSAVVDRAAVTTSSKLRLAVWRDPATGELQFRVGRRLPIEVLIGRDLVTVPDDLDRFPSTDAAWAYVDNEYGVTRKAVDQALKRAERVHRPATMLARVPARPSMTKVHYGSIGDLRKAVHFTVPDPGPVLNGYRRVDFKITRGRPPLDPGPTVDIGYESDVGTAGVAVSGAGSAEGLRVAGALKDDVGPRLRGPHFVADTGDDSYQFRCGNSYVLVSMYVPNTQRWIPILTQVARDCPG